MSREQRHSTSIRVRYCECDPMGVAHHSVYPIWFEIGRTEMLRAAGGDYRELEARGVFLAVAKLDVRYRRPARYDDLLELTTVLEDVGHVKLEHRYELRGSGALLATGRSTLACLDRAGAVQPLPPELVAQCGGAARA
ncbi:MAG TPA: thioesterase family protein [Phycisphaerales bacterium]|nr:thioesterase family protein [Phycisphaerales bacterium]HMP38258.1 thioesterase family protein [Phycisphaerales bacterium]